MSGPVLRWAPALSPKWFAVSFVLMIATCAAAPAIAQQSFAPGSWSSNNDKSCPSELTIAAATNQPFCVAPNPAEPGVTVGNLVPPQFSFAIVSTSGGASSLSSCVVTFKGTGTAGCPIGDPATGSLTYWNPDQTWAIYIAAPLSAPTLPEWGVIGLGVLLALGSLRAFNRSARRNATASL